MAVNENYYTIITSYGKLAFAEANASGRTVQLTEFAVGDGGGSYYAPNETQTALVNEIYRAPINRITTDPDNPNWVIIEGIIPADQGGFTIREVGIFDKDGNLILIGNYPETYKPVLSQGAGNDLYIRVIMEVENGDSVELKIDPAIVLASRKYVSDEITAHNADTTAHDIPNQIANHNADINSHPDIRDSVKFAKYNGINFKNRIINGDFSVWQRGTSFNVNPATGLYTADRFLDWPQPRHGITSKQITKEVYDGPEFSGNVYKLKITGVDSTASDPVFGIAQRVEITNENYRHYLNKTYTLSFWVRTNKSQIETYVVTNDGSANFPQLLAKTHSIEPNKWTKIIWTYNLSQDLFISNNINLNTLNFVELFGIRLNNAQINDYVELAYIQVEEGNEATEFEYVPYDIQLMRCMRYYEVIENAVAWKLPFADDTASYITFRVRKRAIPSITFIRPSDGTVGGADYYWAGGSDKTICGVYGGVNKDCISFGNSAYTPSNTNDARLVTHIHADAEL